MNNQIVYNTQYFQNTLALETMYKNMPTSEFIGRLCTLNLLSFTGENGKCVVEGLTITPSTTNFFIVKKGMCIINSYLISLGDNIINCENITERYLLFTLELNDDYLVKIKVYSSNDKNSFIDFISSEKNLIIKLLDKNNLNNNIYQQNIIINNKEEMIPSYGTFVNNIIKNIEYVYNEYTNRFEI